MKTRKLLAVLLTLAMVLTLVPTMAWAATLDTVDITVRINTDENDTVAYFILNGENVGATSTISLTSHKVTNFYKFSKTPDHENNGFKDYKSKEGDNYLVVKNGYQVTNGVVSATSDNYFKYFKDDNTSYQSFSSNVSDTNVKKYLRLNVAQCVEVSVTSYPEGAPMGTITYAGASAIRNSVPVNSTINIKTDLLSSVSEPYLFVVGNNDYTFDGWYLDDGKGNPTGEKISSTYVLSDQDVAFVANFIVDQWTVTINAGENGTLSTNTYMVNKVSPYNKITWSILNKYATPAENYELVRWVDNEDNVILSSSSDSLVYDVTSDVTLTAVFALKQYTVSFDSASGSSVDSQTVEHGSKATTPAAPTRDGYTFDGWFDGDNAFDFDTPITSNITLTAHWTENTPAQSDEPEQPANPGEEGPFLADGVKFRLAGQLDLFGADMTVADNFAATVKVYRGHDGLYNAGDKSLKFGMNGATSLGLAADETRINQLPVGNVGAEALGVSEDNQTTYDALFNAFDGVLAKISGDTLTINAGGKSAQYYFTKTADFENDEITLAATPSGDFAGVWDSLFNSNTIRSTVETEKSEFFVAGGSSFQIGNEMRTIPHDVHAPLISGEELDFQKFREPFYGDNISAITTVTENTDKVILVLKAGTALQLGESRVTLLRDFTFTVDGLQLASGMVTTLAGNTGDNTLSLINTWTPIFNGTSVTINAEVSDESAADFVGENKLRVAGSLDLFGADLQVGDDYTGSLKIYKGYDGLGGVSPTIRIVANGLGSSTGVVDKTINVGNIGIEALKTALSGTSINPDTITYDWLYNGIIDPLTSNIAKQTVVLHYNNYSKTINFSQSTIKGDENKTVGKTITFTGSGAGFDNTLEDLVGSEAGATILTSYNENAAEQIKFTLVEGSYIRVGNETRTLKTSLNDVSLLDEYGEVDLEPFKAAMMGDIEETLVTGESDGKVVIELLGGTTFTVGRTTVTITKPMRLTVAGLNVADGLISTISGMIEGTNDFSLSDITNLTTIIPASAGTVDITLEVIEPEVAQNGETKYATLAAAVAEAQNGDTIKLIDDIFGSNTVTIPAAKNITLDLNGHSIEAGLESAGRHYYAIDNYGTFTVKDSVGNGYISARGIKNLENGVMTIESGEIRAIDTNGGAAIWNKATLTINGGLFTTTYVGSATESYGPGCLNNSGSATINGGTFNSVNNRCYAIINDGDMTIENATVNGAHGALSAGYGTLTVNGGTFTCTNYYGLWITNDGNETVVTINGGSFTGGLYGLYATVDDGNQDEGDVTVTVTGGSFKGGTAPAVAFKKGSSDHSWGMTITGGKYSTEPDSSYLATGYKAVANTDDDKATYPYKVVERYTEQSTTDTAVTTTTQDGDTTTSTAFAVDTSNENAPTYAIKTEVTTVVNEETTGTTTTYTEVTAVTDTAATVAKAVEDSTSAAKADVVAAVTAYNGSAKSATFTAALAANDAATTEKVLQTTAAANAIAKAAAQPTVTASAIKEAKVILKTELKSFEASTENSAQAKKVTYDITPVAQLYDSNSHPLGQPVALNNEDIEEGQTFTFNIPVPANMSGEKIKVSHIGSNGYATEIGTYTPVGENGEVRYITVTVDHFSDFELEETTVATLGTAKVAANLSLQDEIKINFRVHSINQGADNYHVEYKFGNNELVSKSLSEADDTTNGYKFVVASCAAKQMTDTVTFRLYCGDAMIFSVEYSIRQYCVNKINANTDPKLVALCRSLLDYGAEAQEYFNYEATNLANADNYGNGTLPSIDAGYNHLITSGLVSYTNGITNVKANLTLVSRTELNFKLTAADVSKITDVIVTSSGNESVMWTDSTSGDVMTIKVNGISAKYLDHVYTLSFNYDGTSNSIEYSPLTYAYRNQNKTSDNLGNLCKALYQYWYTAKAYLN